LERCVIENSRLRVAVTPGYGARVVSLFDKEHRREWLTQGAESPNTDEDARYLGPEAVAWDECFPTVGPWDASKTPWRRRLRDHGDLWGRPWRVDGVTPATMTASYAGSGFRFTRELRLDGAAIHADYRLDSLSNEALPYLWALHALFAAVPGERIELPGVQAVRASYLQLGDKVVPASTLDWPGGNSALPFALSEIQPRATGFAGKLLASGVAGGSARIGNPSRWLRLSWDKSISDLGIWLTYGGWPAAGGHQEIAVEPTSAPANHLGEAIDAGARWLAPGEQRQWRVTLTVGP
jgi:galactose mutarotase-like enzyme